MGMCSERVSRLMFGTPGIGQARDPEPGDIRDPEIDKAIADKRKSDLAKAMRIMEGIKNDD